MGGKASLEPHEVWSMVNSSPQTSAEMNSIQLSDEHDLCTIKFLGEAGENAPQACFQYFFGKVTHYWIIARRIIRRESQLPDTCYKQEHPHSLEKCWCFDALYSSFGLQASVYHAGAHERCHLCTDVLSISGRGGTGHITPTLKMDSWTPAVHLGSPGTSSPINTTLLNS